MKFVPTERLERLYRLAWRAEQGLNDRLDAQQEASASGWARDSTRERWRKATAHRLRIGAALTRRAISRRVEALS